MDQFDVPHPQVKDSVSTLMIMDPNLMTIKTAEKKHIQDYKKKLKEDNHHWPWSLIQVNHVLSFFFEIHKSMLELSEKFAKNLMLDSSKKHTPRREGDGPILNWSQVHKCFSSDQEWISNGSLTCKVLHQPFEFIDLPKLLSDDFRKKRKILCKDGKERGFLETLYKYGVRKEKIKEMMQA